MSARDKANRVLIHVILILVSITMLVPFLWMILTAFKTMTEATVYQYLTSDPGSCCMCGSDSNTGRLCIWTSELQR